MVEWEPSFNVVEDGAVAGACIILLQICLMKLSYS
jgi:hypothetical protein